MILFGLDFGRVFLGWVALTNATREAANYAAMNPNAWGTPGITAVQDEYQRLVATEASSINCSLPTPVAVPTFPDGTSIGAPVVVTLTCQFSLITPIISLILGSPVPVSASSAFPVRSGNIEGVPVESTTPTTSPAPSASVAPSASPGPSASVGPTGSPGASSSPSPTPTPTSTSGGGGGPGPSSGPSCTVISLLSFQSNKVQAKWKAAGFSGSVIFSPLVPPNYRIEWQNLTVGTSVSCTSGITVRSGAP